MKTSEVYFQADLSRKGTVKKDVHLRMKRIKKRRLSLFWPKIWCYWGTLFLVTNIREAKKLNFFVRPFERIFKDFIEGHFEILSWKIFQRLLEKSFEVFFWTIFWLEFFAVLFQKNFETFLTNFFEGLFETYERLFETLFQRVFSKSFLNIFEKTFFKDCMHETFWRTLTYSEFEQICVFRNRIEKTCFF